MDAPRQDGNEHELFSEAMSLALDGLLGEAEQQAFDQHLASCDRCHARWVKWQRISDVLLYEPFAGPAVGFALRVDGLVQREQRRKEQMLGGLVLVGGTLSIWAVLALSAAIAVGVWLATTPGVRGQLAEIFGFGSQVAAALAANLASVPDMLLAALPSPAVLVLALGLLAALAILWVRLVLWDGHWRTATTAGGRSLP